MKTSPALSTKKIWTIKKKKVHDEIQYELIWEQEIISFLLDEKQLKDLRDLINKNLNEK